MSFTNPTLLDKTWIKIAPHLVDTALLCSAITLLYVGRWDVGESSWLQIKVAALLLYIVLGSLALKRAKTKRAKVVCSALSISTFLYMISVANTKQPLWFWV